MQLSQVPSRALVVRKNWLDKIVAGEKTIEIRGVQHRQEGNIYLVESKTGKVRAMAYLLPARTLTDVEMDEHRAAIASMNYKYPHAWPLRGVSVLEEPWTISAEARRFCPTWVPRARWERYPVTCAANTSVLAAPISATTSFVSAAGSGRVKFPHGASHDTSRKNTVRHRGDACAPGGEDRGVEQSEGSGNATHDFWKGVNPSEAECAPSAKRLSEHEAAAMVLEIPEQRHSYTDGSAAQVESAGARAEGQQLAGTCSNPPSRKRRRLRSKMYAPQLH